jgi:hypothetical protein
LKRHHFYRIIEDSDADIGVEKATKEHIGWLIARNAAIYPSADKIGAGADAAVAMIVYVGEPGSVDPTLPNARGLAIALNDESGGQWGDETTGNHHFFSIWTDGLATDAATDMNGKSNSKSQLANATAAMRAMTHSIGWPDMQWFLPSAGQWYKFLNGTCGQTWTEWGGCTQGADGFTKIKKMFEAAGVSNAMFSENAFYWTSTEYNAEEAVTIRFNSNFGVDVWHYEKNTSSIKMTSGRKKMSARAFYAF